MFLAVPNPDPEIEVVGVGVSGLLSRPLDKRGGHSPKKSFLAFWASVWSKNKGESPGPPVPSPGSATVLNVITWKVSLEWLYITEFCSQLKLHNIMIYFYWERKDWLNSKDSIISVDNVDFGSSKYS